MSSTVSVRYINNFAVAIASLSALCALLFLMPKYSQTVVSLWFFALSPFDCLASADQVFFLQNHYSKGCKPRCRREMIDYSVRLIALHDNIADGSVERAVSYAGAQGIPVHIVHPLEGPPVRVDPRSCIFDLGSRQVLRSSQNDAAYSAMFSIGKSANMRACW